MGCVVFALLQVDGCSLASLIPLLVRLQPLFDDPVSVTHLYALAFTGLVLGPGLYLLECGDEGACMD